MLRTNDHNKPDFSVSEREKTSRNREQPRKKLGRRREINVNERERGQT